MTAAMLVVAALLQASAQTDQQTTVREIVADVRVHGNVLTPDAEVLQLADIQPGAVIGPETLSSVEARLRLSKRFERVEVLKRFASISDSTQIVVVIIVDEGPVHVERTNDPNQPVRVARSRGPRVMALPLLDVEDGYGVSYGVKLTLPDAVGSHGRLSVPLTWGGSKRAALEFSKDLDRGPLTRVTAGGSLSRRTNPFFEEDDDRAAGWVRGERALTPQLRAGGEMEWQHVSFFDRRDVIAQIGGDLVWDTRLDPVLPRNAVYARIAWNRVAVTGAPRINRWSFDGRGYIGFIGQSVLVLRVQGEQADQVLPPYLQPLLGGFANVRGFRAGTAAGDELAAASAEIREPLISPLRIAKIGVSAFADVGTVYAHGERLADEPMKKGAGASLWFSAAFVRLSVAVAHGVGGSTRLHFETSASF